MNYIYCNMLTFNFHINIYIVSLFFFIRCKIFFTLPSRNVGSFIITQYKIVHMTLNTYIGSNLLEFLFMTFLPHFCHVYKSSVTSQSHLFVHLSSTLQLPCFPNSDSHTNKHWMTKYPSNICETRGPVPQLL